MERRSRSLEALSSLIYIDSLDDDLRAKSFSKWYEDHLTQYSLDELDLDLKELQTLSELLYKNINFFKQYTYNMKSQLDNHKKIKEFLK